MTRDLIVIWLLSLTAVAALCFVIGRISVLDKYIEAVRGCEVIARFDEQATAWLRAQNAPQTDRPRPSAEDHIRHLQAFVATFFGAWRTRMSLPSGRDLTDGEIRDRKTREPKHSRLTWRGTFAELLPANARHEVTL